LLNKLDPTVTDIEAGMSTRYIYSQLAGQPVFEDGAEMAIARQELMELYEQRRELHRRGFPELNPVIMEISEDITLVEGKIYQLAKAKVIELEKQITELKESMEDQQKELDTHPEEELKLIKLTRQRRANEEIYELLLKRYKEAQITEAVASENVSILDPAIPPTQPMNAGKQRKAIFGFIFGLFLGIGVSLIIEIADKSIKTQEDVKRYLKLPILGVIPNVKFDNYELQDSEKAKSISSQIVTHDYSPTPVGEAYRALRTGLLFSKKIGPIRSLVISSVFPGEGKSFTAANLAITLAQQKSKTLLIDADLRRGVLHNNFNSPKKPGLTNYLTGVVPMESILNETYVPNLSLITCGSLIPNPSELLGSVKMKRFIEGITKRFDFTVFDTPPLIAATDAVVLGTMVDGVAIVIRAGKTRREEVQRKIELFNNVQAKIIGIILNGAGIEIAHEGYSYYSY
jgi:capsular exopolysaccharide synthesis family protein